MSFCKAFCGVLLNHEVIKSDLLRGLSSFDYAVLLDGPEENYVSAVESLTSYFVSCGWMTASNKVKAVSQYRSFAIKLRAESGIIRSDWVQFLISHYEMQSCPELLQLFRNACLCLPPVVIEPPKFHVSIPGLESDEHFFPFRSKESAIVLCHSSQCFQLIQESENYQSRVPITWTRT